MILLCFELVTSGVHVVRNCQTGIIVGHLLQGHVTVNTYVVRASLSCQTYNRLRANQCVTTEDRSCIQETIVVQIRILRPCLVISCSRTCTIEGLNVDLVSTCGQTHDVLIVVVVLTKDFSVETVAAPSSTRAVPTSNTLVVSRILDNAGEVLHVVIRSLCIVSRNTQLGLHRLDRSHEAFHLAVLNGLVLDTIVDGIIQSLSLGLRSLVSLRATELHTETLVSIVQLSEQGNRSVDSLAQVVNGNQSVEHLLTVARSKGSSCSFLHLRSLIEDILTHRTAQVELLEFCLKDRLHHLNRRLTIGQLEVVPNAPPVLIGIHAYTNAELVALLGNQTVGSHLVHAPAEALRRTTHRVRILLVVDGLLIPGFYFNHLLANIFRRL